LLLSATQPLLQLCEGQRTPAAPGHNLAIQSELTGQKPESRVQLGKLDDLIQGSRKQLHLVSTLMDLGADAIVFILDQGSAGEQLNGLGGRLNRCGKHAGDRIEEA